MLSLGNQAHRQICADCFHPILARLKNVVNGIDLSKPQEFHPFLPNVLLSVNIDLNRLSYLCSNYFPRKI